MFHGEPCFGDITLTKGEAPATARICKLAFTNRVRVGRLLVRVDLETFRQVNTAMRMRCLCGRGRVFEASGIGPGLLPGRRFAPHRPPAFPDFT